ncbi:(E2-independent) E3 ubiquitin-conjugating enzyme FATS isoform X2 [Erinaceus europaeus]|uniref:(E2-independent) E3 ubiquitin-conjugating enzyme FATS isoform X2 n=1 Tax=Erinaceus europaeus TaxID=9365 RepID=A0ABM3VSA7_ERIEU|nr:(E2-independent) E3 ubiquitin-conjugating enzyme FATS isoform X2 [Erinaceus europaeus]
MRRPLEMSTVALRCQWTVSRLAEGGLQDNWYSANDLIALKNLQSDAAGKKSDFTQEALPMLSPEMISPTVTSQLMNDGEATGPAQAVLGIPTPSSPKWPGGPPLACHRGVAPDRALVLLPGPLGVHMPLQELGPGTEPAPRGDPGGPSPQKGFASITITARRVGPPASTVLWGAREDPQPREPSALAGSPCPQRPYGPAPCTELSRSGSGRRLQEGPRQGWMAPVDSGEDSYSADTPRADQGPLLFSSCVHLRVSQQSPQSIFYLDRSLSVPLEAVAGSGPKLHRSVLSLNLSCNSHGPPADGGGGTANTPRPRRQVPLAPRWSLGSQDSFWKASPPPGPQPLPPGACPWREPPLRGKAELTGAETQQLPAGDKPLAHCPSRQLSIHIPGWSYTAGDYTCCDLVVKIQECKGRAVTTPAEPPPVPPESASPTPAPAKEPETTDLPEESSEDPQVPAPSLTLQEALEVRKPQFISRSQERLKRLEHMAQQRKAQRKDAVAQKQSVPPTRASRKQFTIPHPLSDNLFKPKERSISEKERYMHSKRIYNNLPEVKKKKEEQKKKVALQSNRLRAEVFKKQLLDQLLQRSAV